MLGDGFWVEKKADKLKSKCHAFKNIYPDLTSDERRHMWR
jgi:hypothetical protein